MGIRVIPAGTQHLEACVESALNSQLADRYFPSRERVESFIEQAVSHEQLFVATDDDDNALGFIWVDLNGMFSRFPYLRLIAVRQEHRGKGIGKILLNHFEKIGFEKANKLFLLVSDFNPRAKALYEKVGYRQVGLIPDFILEGVSEQLMMKTAEGTR